MLYKHPYKVETRVKCQLNAGQWSKQSVVFTECSVLISSPVNIHLIKRRTGDSSQCNISSARPLSHTPQPIMTTCP